MFIVWGTRRTERSLGYVADFCAVCREPRAFQLLRIGLVSHVYYISCGAGKHVGHVIRCQECRVDFETEALRYTAFEKARPAELEHLVQTTFPTLRTTYATQLAQIAEIRRAPHALPPAERQTLLIQPFQFLHNAVETRYANGTEMDKPAGLAMLGTIVATVAVGFITSRLAGPDSDATLIAIAAVLCIGGLYTIVQIGLAPGRFLRTRIVPKLAQSLDALRPEESELTECLKKCREVGWIIGKKIKARQILDEIQRGGNVRQTA